MGDKKKLLIKCKSCNVDIESVFYDGKKDEGVTIEESKVNMEKLFAELEIKAAQYDGHKIRVESYGYEGGWGVEMILYRWETDKEYNKRIEKEEKERRAKAERARRRKLKLQDELQKAQDEEKKLLKSLIDKYGVPKELDINTQEKE
jgi:hypothetical protein